MPQDTLWKKVENSLETYLYPNSKKGNLSKKLDKFNYKLIHSLVYSGYILSKWMFAMKMKL